MNTHRITLRYPSDWLAPVHVAHEELRRDTEGFLRSLGVVADAGTERTLAALNVGWYGGAPFWFAPFDRAATITRFLSLWIFHDDVVEGLGAAPAEALGAAIRGEPRRFPGGGPAFRGWWEIGQRFAAVMSERWLARHAARFAAWFHSVDTEAALVRRARTTGRQPPVEAYLAVRETNVGMYPTIGLIEYALGREMDERVFWDPDQATAEQLASRVVALQNDLLGFVKDETSDWTNAVRSAMEENGGSRAAAFDRMARLHDTYVEGLVAAGRRLCRRHGENARWWMTALGHVVAGLGRWQANTPRYREAATLPGGGRVEITVAARETESAPSKPRARAATMSASTS
ncbi:MAG: terpene synthase family protein [Minicystis sp.]